MGMISLAELAHNSHAGEALARDLRGASFDLGFIKPFDLLPPEVDSAIQDYGLA